MALADFPTVIKSTIGVLLSALGTPFLLSSDGSTWTSYSTIASLMDIADVPPLLLEESGSAYNMAWHLFDDMPTWLGGASNGERLELARTAIDPETKQRIRLMTVAVDIDAQPLTLCYHFIDWLEGQRLSRRLVMRVVFRNTALDDDLEWLRAAGFEGIELLGGFDGRPFDRVNLGENLRLIVRCRRPA